MIAPLSALYAHAAHGAPSFGPGFGPLAPALPLNTADLVVPGVFDFRNRPLLSLPPEFRYWAISCTGQAMSDGTIVPGGHDGMAAFRGPELMVVRVPLPSPASVPCSLPHWG